VNVVMGGRKVDRRTEQSFELFIDTVKDYAIFILDPDGTVVSWNQGAERIKGYRANEIIGRHFSVFYTDEDRAAGRPEQALAEASSTGRYEGEGLRVRNDGSHFFADVVITALHDDAGNLTGFGKVTRDITSRHRAEEEQSRQLSRVEAIARTDALTGMPNRRAWDEELMREMDRATRAGHPLGVALLDLDHFKLFNDERGHMAGDRLLQEAATEWRLRLRVSDFMARYGGEEFAVTLPSCTPEGARVVIDRVREATPQGQSCSAGAVVWDGDETPDAVVGRADAALYQAKQAGRNRTIVA
jgi:diguanylate cyclase (GGDEF)-like protein/PAS domain S-box-containing protein